MASAAPADDAPADVGRKIEDFQLQDFLGTKHSLAEWNNSKLVVVVFLGAECPLAKLYGGPLAELVDHYEPQGVKFVGINSNQQDSLAEMAHYARRHELKFLQLKDPGHTVADQFGAQRTPEVFVLDENRAVRYAGRIDDQFGVGYVRAGVRRRYLAEALDELLAGEPVSTPAVEAVGCFIGRVRRETSGGDVTYSRQIARVFQDHCVQCHRPGQIAPFAMTSYNEVAGWAETIREVIEDRRMPPWHANPGFGSFANDCRLSDEEKRLVYQWVADGAPEGDPDELPVPREYDEDWRIPTPDVVYTMPEAFEVPAEGVVPYKYFVVDPGFEEDRWVAAAEGRPGNRAVVHHLILFFQTPDKNRIDPVDALFNAVAAFSPGMPAGIYPAGYARRIPAGSKLIFQVHYTPNGSPQTDVSSAGLVFADPAEVKKEIKIGAALEFRFRIPPGADNHRVEATHRFDQDTLLYSLLPHMHLRGKSFRFDAHYPDGTTETLLDVPRYDFNWQNSYVLAEAKRMPEGTELHCTAHYDNSENNLVNPDPTATVGWGDQTWNEMLVGSFEFAAPDQDLSLGLPEVRPADDGRFEVRFKYKPPAPVDAVYLAGNFNDWQPREHAMEGPNADGFYSTSVPLAAGTYEYKFVLDGEDWKSDPANPRHTGFYQNSVLDVGRGD
jgi:peroxiredoxin